MYSQAYLGKKYASENMTVSDDPAHTLNILIEHHRQGFSCDGAQAKSLNVDPPIRGGVSFENVFSTPSKIFAGAQKVWSSKLY